jgi:hypothetical protein
VPPLSGARFDAIASCETNSEPALSRQFRNFEWKVPLPACKLSRDDIKRLYRIIDDKQIEDRDNIVNHVL